MEVLKNVLIKEIVGPDMVMVVNNLPKELVYHKVPKLVFIPRYAVDYDRTEPRMVEAYTLRDEDMPDEPRNRRVSHEMVDELLPGIEKSQTDDNGIVFWVLETPEAKERLAAIDRYIRSVTNPMLPVPSRVSYTSVEKSFSASPKSLSQIPRIELPMPVSPPTAKADVQDKVIPSVNSSPSESEEQEESHPMVVRNPRGRPRLTEEQKEKQRAILADARAKKEAKKNKANAA